MAKNHGGERFETTVSQLAGMPAEGLDALLSANARAAQLWFGSWTKMATEIGSFVTRRWACDAELMGRVCNCKSPADLLELQAKFVERAMNDYMQETAKLADMETEAITEEIEEMSKGAREASTLASSRRENARPLHKRAAAH